MAQLRRDTGRGSGGQALVEFCFCLPFLMLMLIAIIEFGQLYAVWFTTEQAAFEGARLVATDNLPASENAKITARVNAILGTVRTGLVANSVAITRDTSTVQVEVIVQVPVFLPDLSSSQIKVNGYGTQTFTIRSAHRARFI